MTSHAAPNWSRIAREVLGEYVKWFAAIWLIVVVLTGAIIGTVAYFGTPATSIVDFVLNPPRYWLFVVGLLFTHAWLAPYVACGVTRRDFAIGGVLAGLAASLVVAVLCALLVVAEGRVYAVAGWKVDYESTHLYTAPDQWGLLLVEFGLVFGAHYFAGWALGTLFYRYGAWAVLAAVPVFALPTGTEVVLGTGWAGRLVIENLYDFDPSWSLSLGVGAVVIALLYGLVWTLVRNAAIPAKKS